ncbi:MAG: hypothetical protein RSG96_09745, partial [Clostridia bacterium]
MALTRPEEDVVIDKQAIYDIIKENKGDAFMKKTIVLTLILTMFALPAMGESVDLSTIGFSDLIELRDNVEVELKTRPEYEEKGYGGLFIGGKNINVGSYFLTCIGTVTISMWKSEREFERSYDPIMDNEYSDGELV